MTGALVSLPHLEVKWSRPDEPLLVGKDILELLSSSMYVDPMSLYREYVQNAADAIDQARLAEELRGPGRVEIRIDQSTRSVFIRDNGSGLGRKTFTHRLTALGGSQKRGTQARGFRGVGRLAGLAFCQELIFRSRQDNEDTVHELRWDSREIRTLLRSTDSSADLREIVGKTIETREVPGRKWPKRFFEVELRGIVRHRDDRLLNEIQVANYIAQVAPVPFHSDFSTGEQIRKVLETYGIRPGEIEIDLAGYGIIYRPHRDVIGMGKSGESRFQELTTVQTPGRDGEVAAVTWILHHDYRGTLPSNSLVDGWRFRCGDIQVGGNDLLQSLFPEPRFNAWCIAETHVLDARILPNGRRDHFEQNTHYFDLVNHLTPQARDIAQRCRASSIARNLVKALDERLMHCQQSLRVMEKGLMADASASKARSELDRVLDQLQRLTARTGLDASQRLQYQRQIKRFKNRLTKVDSTRFNRPILVDLSFSQRKVLGEVFSVIYQSERDLQRAQHLVDKIVAKVKRTCLDKATKRKSG